MVTTNIEDLFEQAAGQNGQEQNLPARYVVPVLRRGTILVSLGHVQGALSCPKNMGLAEQCFS